MMRWQKNLAVALAGAMLAFGAMAATAQQEQRALHVLNRLAYGPKPGDVEAVSRIGIEHYIEQQLHPERIPLPPALSRELNELPSAFQPAPELVAEYFRTRKAGREDKAEKKQQRNFVREVAEETVQARLVRAIDSPGQLEEVMVEFWFNHFNVFIGKGLDRPLTASYEREAIRPYVFGRFRDLLGATAHHPAMLYYLDNWLSSAANGANGDQPMKKKKKSQGLNENYARELMELHTLGVDGGYTQKDVTELARIFTGWTFDPHRLAAGEGGFYFDRQRHDWGAKTWLGRQVAPRGVEEGEWALDVLAWHPVTARRISHALAQYFVADQPPPALVERMTKRFLNTQGDIRAVLRVVFESDEFWNASGAKFKTPYRFVVSAVRASDLPVKNYRPLLAMLNQQGMLPYHCPTPDGYRYTEQAWLNPDALGYRINFATALGAGRLPLNHEPNPNQRNIRKMFVKGDANDKTVDSPVDPQRLLSTLGSSISKQTRDKVAAGNANLRSALVLGSPDFMRH